MPGEAGTLDWSEDEESTSVFAGSRSSAPTSEDLDQTLYRNGAPVPPPSSAHMAPSAPRSPAGMRAPRIVPPAPSRSTLLGVHPTDLRGQPTQPLATQALVKQQQPFAPSPSAAPAANPYAANGLALPPPAAVPQAHPQSFVTAAQAVPQAPPALEFPPPAERQQALASIPPAQPVVASNEAAFQRLAAARPGAVTEVSTRRQFASLPDAHAESSSTGKLAIGIALVTALVTAAAAGAFFFMRRPGGLEIDVRDPSGSSVAALDVYVDGKKVCGSTPCIVKDLEPGPKAVRVVAPGYATEEPQTMDVSAGGTNKMAIVLKPAFGTLVASSEQPGLRLFVDGTDRGPLPAKIGDVAPGTHQIRVAGSDRYKALEKSVDVKVGEQIDLGSVKLEVVRGKVRVVLKTEGATITLIPNDDESKAKALPGPFPRDVEVEKNSGSWKLVAKKKGLPDFVSRLDFSDGVAEKTLDVVLGEPAKADSNDAAIAKNTSQSSSSSNSSSSHETPSPTPTPAPEKTSAPDSSSGDSGQAFLNINSIPVSHILLDGQPMGETPKQGVQVSPGTHTVTFISPDLPKKSVTVTVKAGETKGASAKLRD